MSEAIAAEVSWFFIVFCRFGGCLMLMPGISSAHIPMKMRLFIAIALSLAVSPTVLDDVRVTGSEPTVSELFRLVASETMTGALLGMMGRMFFLALEAMATGVAMMVGLTSNLGAPIDENEPLPALATLFTFTATMLLFAADLHWQLINGLVQSYKSLPIGHGFNAQSSLVQIANVLAQSFLIAMRVASPFIAYGLVVNFAFGLVNKLVPQVPVYFISLPFVVAGGLILLHFALPHGMSLYLGAFAGWIAHE